MPTQIRNPFKSKRIRPLEQPARPQPAAPFGGWAPASETGGPYLEPEEQARAERSSGAAALAELARRREAERRAAMDARLGAAPRGYDLSKGLYARFPREES